MPLASIDHVLVAVRDLEAVTADYEKLIGRSVSLTGSHPDYGTANAIFQLENTYVELISPVGEGPFADRLTAFLDACGDGLIGIALGTENAQALSEEWRAAGLHASAPQPGEGHAPDGWGGMRIPLPPLGNVRLLVAARLLRAGKSGFLTTIGGLTIGAVAFSSCTLVTTLSVMGGFRNDLKRKDNKYQDRNQSDDRYGNGPAASHPFQPISNRIKEVGNRAPHDKRQDDIAQEPQCQKEQNCGNAPVFELCSDRKGHLRLGLVSVS